MAPPDLVALCRQVAEGASGPKRRAWAALRGDGSLWRACEHALGDSSLLARAEELLAGPWDRSPLVRSGPGAAAVDRDVAAARRLISAAAAAAHAGALPVDVEALAEWTARAAGLETAIEPSLGCPAPAGES